MQLSAGFAGTERHAVELACGLSDRAEVALLVRRPPGAGHDGVAYRAMRAAIAPDIPTFLAPGSLPAPAIWAAIARFRPDILHAHANRSARLASRHARPFRVPVVATLHLHYDAGDFGRCAGLIALTPGELARARREYQGPTALIENWVTSWPRPDAARLTALRREFAIPPDAFVFGSVGRLEPVKRMSALIAAFAEAGRPDAHLLIVGEGSERGRLATQIAASGLQSRVHVAGFRADARDFYALFDHFVLCSADEPYGLVLLEAAEQGTPITATATEGARAIARRTPIALIAIDDPAMLTQSLREARRERPARPESLLGFSRDDRVDETLAFYRYVMDGRVMNGT